MAQRMHRYMLVDACGISRFAHGAVELAGAERIDRIQARKQPATIEHLALDAGDAPPGTQPLEQYWREHGVAVFAAFALFDAQRHALTVDIANLEGDDFAGDPVIAGLAEPPYKREG